MQNIGDPRQLLVKIAGILENLKIPYMVTGGMAVFVWGRPRFTADIDIVVEFKQKNIDELARALEILGKANYVDKEMMLKAFLRRSEFNFIHGETGVKVDFWILNENSFDKERLERRVGRKILNKKVYFISPEDLILSKLRWNKESESTRHLEDIESVLKISKVDIKYVEKQARKQSTLEIFENLLNKTRKKQSSLKR